MYTVQDTVHVHMILYTVYRILYTVHRILYTVYRILYALYRILYTAHRIFTHEVHASYLHWNLHSTTKL